MVTEIPGAGSPFSFSTLPFTSIFSGGSFPGLSVFALMTIILSVILNSTAWSMQPDFVASTIVGASRLEQMDDILAAADLVLPREVLDQIDQVSREFMYPMG